MQRQHRLCQGLLPHDGLQAPAALRSVPGHETVRRVLCSREPSEELLRLNSVHLLLPLRRRAGLQATVVHTTVWAECHGGPQVYASQHAPVHPGHDGLRPPLQQTQCLRCACRVAAAAALPGASRVPCLKHFGVDGKLIFTNTFATLQLLLM